MFLGDHITISQDGPVIESPSLQSSHSNDDQDMKEVQIETTNPSHLFWVPFHLHPEIAPNEYNRWLSKHGVDSQDTDGIVSSRRTSVTRRKSVLSAQYNPEEDQDEEPCKPTTISKQSENHDSPSEVFSTPLEQMGQPPMRTKTSIRRSVSLSASSPTKENFPVDTDEESIMAVKRPGGLERGGLSLLRRSARTKIRRNSTANDIRPDASRLRQTLNPTGEYDPVSLVDPGPQPLPSSLQHSESVSTAPVDNAGARKDGDPQPSKRFVSTLRDPSKPTITTYVEPHLLEQQRKENEEEAKRGEGESSPSFRISAPGKLENTAARLLAETIENDRQERPESLPISYPIPPPVKLTQNLLQQQPSSPQSPTPKPATSSTSSTPTTPSTPPTQLTQPSSKQKNSGQANTNGTSSHAKKPSTWSWLWGKEKGSEKAADSLSNEPNVSHPPAQTANTEINTQTSPNEATIKKQSTLSMLFSRNSKSSKAHAASAESTQSSATNSGRMVLSDRPKYSNYNRLPIHIERAIYRLSHVKLANPRRPLQEQVLISNMMFWYLGVIQQQQMLQQQQVEQQQQQLAQLQKEGSKGPDSKEEGKDSKSKNKPKKRKSQKKKNQQRGSSKSAERIVKSPEYEIQQQYHNNAGVSHVARPRQQGPNQAPLVNQIPENQRRTRRNTDQDGRDFSDIYESGSEDSDSAHKLMKQQIGSQSDTPMTLSVGSLPQSAQEGGEDDDVPLAHYQNIPRQSVPARGPKKHLKRLNAPKHWMLDKLTGTYAPRPTAGPHKLRECLPLIILLRNRLKYALNGKEVQSILMQRLVKVDNKVRTDTTFPAGFMDAITIEKTGENFRLVYDTKGRFTVHRITAEEAKYKLCKVKKVQLGAKGIPFVVTHDGRTIRYPDPLVKVNDTIKLDLESGKFTEFIKFEVGNVAMVTGGRNTGRVGVITHKERHIGGFDIVHIKDVLDRQFATRLSNVFVIGEGNKPWVSLPKNKGVKLTIAEERDRRRAAN
ncbi:40S ribosomal protein S4 [Mortierella sp. AD010]|nr:40S ribosomal protein S4 [Mortierella sp. AD010]